MSEATSPKTEQTDEPEVIIRQEGRAGRITLNRPKALNALNHSQIGTISRALSKWQDIPEVEFIILDSTGDRALCAGGDVLAIYASHSDDPTFGNRFWNDEYHLNLAIAEYPKPYVALMDGIVMGGGIGLSGHASHRVTTERSMLAMPETTIGLVPDVGGSWLLANAPGHLGEYYGLLGDRMNSADALYADFADTHIASDQLPSLIKTLCNPSGGPLGVTIAEFASAPTSTVHADRQADIDTIFSASSVGEIITRLRNSNADWAERALSDLAKRSPLSLALTLASIREARRLGSLAHALDIEYRLTTRLLAHGEFLEGIRALLVDKDRAPKWNPKELTAVTDEMIASFLAPLPAGEELGLARSI